MPKCYICKKDIESGKQYKVHTLTNKGNLTSKNVCSKEEWDGYCKEMEYRKLIFEALFDYMGYDTTQLVPAVVSKEISALHNHYTYRVIYNVIRSLEDGIRFAMGKDFKTDFAKGKYLAAMLRNSINDEYEKLKRQAKVERNRENQHVDIEEIQDVEISKPINKINDISMFL